MLAKIGVKVNLRAQTRNLYFAKILRKNDLSPGETSFYMLGWSPAQTYDVHNVFEALIQTPNKDDQEGPVQRRRLFEPGARQARRRHGAGDRQGQARRDDRQATKLYVDDFAYIPLHQQAVVWAARKNIDLVQPADNYLPAALRDGEVATLHASLADPRPGCAGSAHAAGVRLPARC